MRYLVWALLAVSGLMVLAACQSTGPSQTAAGRLQPPHLSKARSGASIPSLWPSPPDRAIISCGPPFRITHMLTTEILVLY